MQQKTVGYLRSIVSVIAGGFVVYMLYDAYRSREWNLLIVVAMVVSTMTILILYARGSEEWVHQTKGNRVKAQTGR